MNFEDRFSSISECAWLIMVADVGQDRKICGIKGFGRDDTFK